MYILRLNAEYSMWIYFRKTKTTSIISVLMSDQVHTRIKTTIIPLALYMHIRELRYEFCQLAQLSHKCLSTSAIFGYYFVNNIKSKPCEKVFQIFNCKWIYNDWLILTTIVIESFIFTAYYIPVLKRLPTKNGGVRNANWLILIYSKCAQYNIAYKL